MSKSILEKKSAKLQAFTLPSSFRLVGWADEPCGVMISPTITAVWNSESLFLQV
jgi:hypothetical protein